MTINAKERNVYMENNKLCCECVNFLVEDGNKASCDYEYWEDVNIYKAWIFVPDLFDCINWEKHPEEE